MKKAKIKTTLLIVILCNLMLISSSPVSGIEPAFSVYGPYLIEMNEESVTIKWLTDVDAYAELEYGTNGQFQNSRISTEDGLVKVGKQHEIQLTGLSAGTTYNYRIKTTEVLDIGSSNPVFGNTEISPDYTFTTNDPSKISTTFWFLTDTHADTTRMNNLLSLIDHNNTDFIAFGGDDFDNPESHNIVMSHFVEPVTNYFATTIPIVYAHGNHDYWGNYSQQLYSYLNTEGTEWYRGFNQGPAGFVVFDSGGMYPDSASHLKGMMRTSEYRAQEYPWLQEYFNSSEFLNAPAKIMFSHEPFLGLDHDHPPYPKTAWYDLANEAGVQLIISGHTHEHQFFEAGELGHDFYQLVLDQDEIAKVQVTADTIDITVFDDVGVVIHTYSIDLDYVVPESVNGRTLGDLYGKNDYGTPLELGTIFESSVDGQITAVRTYGAVNDAAGNHTIRIWDNATNQIVAGPYTFNYIAYPYWWAYYLPTPLNIEAGKEYTVSVSTGTGSNANYSFIDGTFQLPGNNGGSISWPANAGVYSTTLGDRPTLNDGNGTNYMRDILFVPE